MFVFFNAKVQKAQRRKECRSLRLCAFCTFALKFLVTFKIIIAVILLFLFTLVTPLYAEESGVTVDLREPHYCDGLLLTEKGGIISAPGLRIQAEQLKYTKKESLWTIEGEGDLIIEFSEAVFVGEKLNYNFATREGIITKGRLAIPPWFFGGDEIELKSDGTYLIRDGYITTSERSLPEWGILSENIAIDQNNNLKASDVHFKVGDTTVFWLPSFKTNLNTIFDNPIRYRFRWGGHQGPRVGLTYEVLAWKNWKTLLRFDYRITRGPGGGIETTYRSPDKKTEFQSINYISKDSSILHPNEKARYEFEGSFRKRMDDDKTTLLATYDKVSDKDMPSTYFDRDFDFVTTGRTQLQIRRQEEWGIATFYSRVRINSFQTVKEELPTLRVCYKPFSIKQTGIIFENAASASYLQFQYSKHLLDFHNYCSTRFQYFPTFYRPFVFGPWCTLTPEVGMIAILYGNSPEKEQEGQTIGKAGLRLQTHLFHSYGSFKHVIEPYVHYRYFSSPTCPHRHHYIFDITDGWARLNYLAFGVNNSFLGTPGKAQNFPSASCDLYSFAFFDTEKIRQSIPRVYGKFSVLALSTLRHVIHTGWNIDQGQLDFFHFRTEWTVNADLALSSEYRHRGPYWWRKVDKENFFLDMVHSEERLYHSLVSERSDTLLLHAFYRFIPNWSVELTTRQGWNKKRSPSYFEYEIDLLTTIQSAWHLRLSYQHQENDDRFAMYLNVGVAP